MWRVNRFFSLQKTAISVFRIGDGNYSFFDNISAFFMHFRMQVKHASIHLRNGKSAIQSQERMRHCGALQLMGLPFRCMVTTFPMTDAEEVNPSRYRLPSPVVI